VSGAVRGNDWSQVGVADPADFAPAMPASVIVPYHRHHAVALPKTLATLDRQSYPRDMFEVVVVDDGSDPPLDRLPATGFAARLVRQERRGFGLARARNTGARAASCDILLFLDADILVDAAWIAAHARWHHAISDALTLGLTSYVDTADLRVDSIRNGRSPLRDLLADRPADPPRSEGLLLRTDDLKSRDDRVFMAMAGNNFGIRKEFYHQLGGSDESFTRWGYEDTEIAYRAYVRGGLLVATRDAVAWHQGRWEEDRSRRGSRIQHEKAAQLIAHRVFRGVESGGRIYAVPKFVVSLDAGDLPAEAIVETTTGLLTDRIHDLVVRIEMRGACGREKAPGEERFVRLSEAFGSDPRVRLAAPGRALREFPASPFHVALPSGVVFARGLVRRLRKGLGAAAVAAATLPNGNRVSIARAWALHRAARTGGRPEDFGDARKLSAASLRVACRGGARAGPLNAASARYPKRRRLIDSLLHARSAGGWAWLKWSAYTLLRFLGRGDARVLSSLSTTAWRVANRRRLLRWRFEHAISATSRRGAGKGAEKARPPARFRPVQPFDPRLWNPIRWRRDAGNRIAALGPIEKLPSEVAAHGVVCADRLFRLRRMHHVVDVQAFHSDAVARAGTLVRLAGAGTLVHVADGGPGLAELIGRELHGLMTKDPTGMDAACRERRSIRMRRIALRDHSLAARARQRGEGAPLPLVSVLLATRRPGCLAGALSAVAKQTYPRLELVLALHGEGFGDAERLAAELPHPATVVRVAAREPLGAVLAAATAASKGTLLTKMDDDDLYDAEHVWDLALGHEYSRAQLVSKGLEFAYLSGLDRTVHLHAGRGEDYRTMTWAGGTLMISRRDLARAGGWPRVPRGVDKRLVEAVLRARGCIYRIHGSGYLMVRRRSGHTWDVADDYFMSRADTTVRGWAPDLAGVPDDRASPAEALPAPP